MSGGTGETSNTNAEGADSAVAAMSPSLPLPNANLADARCRGHGPLTRRAFSLASTSADVEAS